MGVGIFERTSKIIGITEEKRKIDAKANNQKTRRTKAFFSRRNETHFSGYSARSEIRLMC